MLALQIADVLGGQHFVDTGGRLRPFGGRRPAAATSAAFETFRPRRFGVFTAERYRSTVADIVRPSASARLCAALSVRCAGRLAAFLVVFLRGAAFAAAVFVAGMRILLSRKQRANNVTLSPSILYSQAQSRTSVTPMSSARTVVKTIALGND